MSSLHLCSGSSCPPLEEGVLRCYNMKYCPFGQRALLVLASKKVKHEIVNINLINKPEWFLQKNPLGKVPTLEKDGQLMYESLVICDYLDEVYPDPPLHPADPWKKGQDRHILEHWNKVHVSVFKSIRANDQESIIHNLNDVYDGLDYFETELTKRRTIFFGGAKPGMLDYMIWPWFEWLPAIQRAADDKAAISKQRFPKLLSWMACMREDPAVQAVLISTNTRHQHMQNVMNKTINYDMEEIP